MPLRPPAPSGARRQNRLLGRLPAADLARIQPQLKTTPLAVRDVLQHPEQPIRQVFFINSGVASITGALPSGEMIEVATVGDEGFVGVDAIFSDRAVGRETMLQVPAADGHTTADVMTAEDFRREYAAGGAFQQAVHVYMQGFMSVLMRATPCFGFHSVQERTARWLLLTHDRVHSDEFELSHEFLALMLGASRPTVTVAAGVLRTAGLIRYTHGRVTILDRPGLEAASCDCYAVLKADFDRLGL